MNRPRIQRTLFILCVALTGGLAIPISAKSEQQKVNAQIPVRYEMVQVNGVVDANAKSKTQHYQLHGRGSRNAKIVDAHGNTVIQPDPNTAIYGCEASPNGKRLIVYYGSAEYVLWEPANGTKTALPKQPAGENKLGFGSYHWVDDQTLIAESGDYKVNANGKPVQSDSNVARTRLYVYSISRKTLEELELPKKIGANVFAISEVNSDGHFHLVQEDPSSPRPTDLGWFQVRSKK